MKKLAIVLATTLSFGITAMAQAGPKSPPAEAKKDGKQDDKKTEPAAEKNDGKKDEKKDEKKAEPAAEKNDGGKTSAPTGEGKK